jgi:hypothetical protein
MASDWLDMSSAKTPMYQANCLRLQRSASEPLDAELGHRYLKNGIPPPPAHGGTF